jgi:hypothetical protein
MVSCIFQFCGPFWKKRKLHGHFFNLQRILEHCKDAKTQSKVMDEILGAVSMLAQDQYGNYVVQVGFSFQGLPLWMHICHYLSD